MLPLLLAGLVVGASAAVEHHRHAVIDNLFTFGDSFSDEGRAGYIFAHGSPPPGLVLPVSNSTYSGGYTWSRLAARRLDAASYDYAVGGAMCSSALSDRSLNGEPFPSVLDYEVPAFEADVDSAADRGRRHRPAPGGPGEYGDGDGWDRGAELFPDRRHRRADNSVYTLWIGTNDMGDMGILGGLERPGQTLSSMTDCVWAVFDRLYREGGRRFVLVNQLPLEMAPLYAQPGVYGGGNNRFRRDPAAYNVSQFADTMRQYTTAVNTMFEYGLPFHLFVRDRWPGAVFSILDAHAIVSDVIADPARSLDAPANVTAPYRRCTPDCVNGPEPLSSFMW